MMGISEATSGDPWLTHAESLRALAAALTLNASDADDLVQETWLRAARNGDVADRPRAWWSAIVRNLARDRGRERRARDYAEREAARDDRLPSEVEVLARLEIAQRVATEVARLDEPYRTAIHLRYFEGLSPEEIARRSAEPLETIRARLRRGLARLRERMDRACGGDRNVWHHSLAAIAFRGEPLELPAAGSSLVSIGVLAMSTKFVLGIAAVVVLGVGVYLVRPSGSRADQSTAVVEAPAPEVLPLPIAVDTLANETALVTRSPVAPPIASTPAQTSPGALVVLDESGAEHASESGSFQLLVTEPRRDAVRVDVKEGRWSHPIPEGATYYVNSIVLGERSAIALPDAGPFVANAQAPRLRCEWAAVTRLHVVDAESGAELDGIRLYTVPQFDAESVLLQRPKAGLVGEDLHSPIDVHYAPDEHGGGLPMHFAGRDGYAWGSIQIDPRAGGDLVLRLAPGGDLRVVFEGATPDPRLRLRLYSRSGAETKWIFECGGEQLERGPPSALELEGIVAGEYMLRAEVGKLNEAYFLAKQDFTIVAGLTSNVTLAIPELPAAEKVLVAITLVMDPAWNPQKLNVWVKPMDVDVRSSSSMGQHIGSSRWTLVDARTRTAQPILVDPGRYVCTIDDLCFATEVMIGPDPRQQVLLTVPDPVKVLVHVVDGETGEPVGGLHYTCAWKGPSDTDFQGGSQSRRETARGELDFLAPIGTVRVSVATRQYGLIAKTLDIAPGVNELRLEVHRNYEVEFILHEGESVVPWAASVADQLRVESASGKREFGKSFTSTGRLTSFVPDAGVYRVTLPRMPGYLPIEPFDVTLDKRVLIEKVIQIVRE